MDIKVKKPDVEPVFTPSIVQDLGGGFLIRLTREDLNPQEHNTFLRIRPDGTVERPNLGPNFKEHLRVNSDGQPVVV